MAKNQMYLYGKNSVLERLKADPKSIKTIYLENSFDTPHILEAIDAVSVPVRRVSEKELTKVKRADRLQGIVAAVDEFKYTPFEKFLDGPKDTSLIFVDNLNDPHNLGSIIRIAACFGNFAVVLPRHGSCEVTDAVMHVASGGENFVPVSMANNLSTALLKSKDAGYWVVGTVITDGEDINKVSLPFPICLVLGSEGKGIRYGIQKHLDVKVTLPMKGAALSFNVAMAAAIFSYEITRQKAKSGGKS
ncbi:23S rRNA (guanosine(2251)-2'-O)-methyltransferase RlmB [Candidatus Omnitrophota bacterium]